MSLLGRDAPTLRPALFHRVGYPVRVASASDGDNSRSPPAEAAFDDRGAQALFECRQPAYAHADHDASPFDAVGFRRSVEKPNFDDLDGHLLDRGGRIGRRRPRGVVAV